MNPLVILGRCFLLPLASALHNASSGCRTVARTRTEPRDTNFKRVANGLKSNEKLFYILANTRADGRAAGRPVGGVEDTKVGAALRLRRVASEPRVGYIYRTRAPRQNGRSGKALRRRPPSACASPP